MPSRLRFSGKYRQKHLGILTVAQGSLFPEFDVDETVRRVSKKESQVDILRQQNQQYREKVEQMELELAQLREEKSVLQKKAEAFDELIASRSLFPIGVIAKSVGRSAIWLNKYLQQKKVQYFRSDVWMLYSKYDHCGYTRVCWYNYSEDSQGRTLSRPHTYWTSKGFMFIRSLLEKDGLL